MLGCVRKDSLRRRVSTSLETFSPVAREPTFKLLLSLGTAEGFKYRYLDVKTAFLNGILSEHIYICMKIPKYIMRMDDADKEYVLELHKALCGLKQASRDWHQILMHS